MKTGKKYTTMIIAIAIVALIIIKLFSNKSKLDSELRAMLEYNYIIPVEIVSPQTLQAKQILEENGILRAGAEITILSEISGKAMTVSGNVGEYVSAGQPLLVVEKDVLESQYRLAEINYENAGKDLLRFSNLAGGDAITQQQMEGAKLRYQNALASYTAIKKQIENTVIRSPVNGVISKRSVEAGVFVIPSMPVFSIVQLNRMVFVVKVAGTDILHLNKELKPRITLDALPGKSFIGNIRSIGVTADLSGRYEVEIIIEGQDGLLRTGMDGKACFEIDFQDAGVVIPRKCVVGSVNNAAVFILRDDSVSLTSVNAMTINEAEILVTEGLSVNDKVVISGQINLQEGCKVKVINQ